MSAFVAAALRAGLAFLASLILGAWREWQSARAHEAKGRAEGAAETQAVVSETADAQAEVNAARRGGAADVARRLRDDARRARGDGKAGSGP